MSDTTKNEREAAELIALSALANLEAAQMAGDNQQRAICGYSPMWTSGCGFMPYGEELAKRMDDILKKQSDE